MRFDYFFSPRTDFSLVFLSNCVQIRILGSFAVIGPMQDDEINLRLIFRDVTLPVILNSRGSRLPRNDTMVWRSKTSLTDCVVLEIGALIVRSVVLMCIASSFDLISVTPNAPCPFPFQGRKCVADHC